MKYRKKKIKILVLGIILAISVISIQNFSDDKEINKSKTRLDVGKLESSEGYDPAGLIALWSGPLDTIPYGWKLCNGSSGTPDTSDRFISFTDSMEEPGATGGSTSHRHSYTTVPWHDHGETSFADCAHTHSYLSGLVPIPGAPGFIPILAFDGEYHPTGSNDASHSHGVEQVGASTCYTSVEENIIPPYYELAFIKKETNDPVIPTGLIVMWAGNIEDIPVDWALCNGSNGTPDLRDRFIRGVNSGENPGTFGGSVDHNHTYTDIPRHTHSLQVSGNDHTHDYEHTVINALGWPSPFPPWLVNGVKSSSTSSTSVPHTHTMHEVGQPTCTTENDTTLPPYYKTAFIMNKIVTDALPMGSIVMWGNLTADIPVGWNQCNGTYGTPDMRNNLMRGVATGEQPGITGGAASHRHLYTQVPLHSHQIYQDLHTHSHTVSVPSDLPVTISLVAPGIIFSSDFFTRTTTSAYIHHNHDILPSGSSVCYTAYENNLPPFIKLKCIQKKSFISNPSPNDGAANIDYNPTLSVDVFDYDGDDLTVTFYNASDNGVIGIDTVSGGSGTASVSWSGLSERTTYSWNVTVDDGVSTIQSNTWSFTTNYVPNEPFNPFPNDGATNINYGPTLNVDVFDYDGGDLTVTFYDASDNNIIDIDTISGGSGTASVSWLGRSEGTTYSWNVTVDDGVSTNQSNTWSFTTNYVPNEPFNPFPNDGATNINYNPLLNVTVFDNDGDDLTITFYNASDNSVIGIDTVSGGSGMASVTWSGLSINTNYSWYAIVDDGLSLNQSLTWKFTTLVGGGDDGGGGGGGSKVKEPGILDVLTSPVGMIVIGLSASGVIAGVASYMFLKKRKIRRA